MSIPPLVCSSPPPPEQCEDDKEPEDFDFQYNSQPDDDDDSTSYNYDNFTSNVIYKTEEESIQNIRISHNIRDEIPNISPLPETEKSNSIPHNMAEDFERNSDPPEDCILEDLNLELTTDCLQINAPDKTNDISNILNVDSSNTVNMQDEGGTDNDCIHLKSLSQSSNENEDLQILDNLSADILFNDPKQYNEDAVVVDSLTDDEKKIEETQEMSSNKPIGVEIKTVDDDDFGDFDSFQCTNSEVVNTESHSIFNTENPWENQNDEDQDFGDFTANFENNEPLTSKVNLNQENVSEIKDIAESTYSDDDFGDFDDFKSSDKITRSNSPTSEDISSCSNVLNFATDNETQVIENINNVLVTIFPEELVEPEDPLEASLELSLGETWGHLVDTDVRQPYMVNWNNTLGQKSLLKALCIDSRNILFGTRWNYNMPKFAANLSTSPLQPQKQATQSGPESNAQVLEKDANTWVDPFTPHGQEYTYAEALLLDLEHLMATLDQMAHKHSTLKISDLLSHACNTESETPAADDKPKGLDGFTSELPSSTSKIYSSTLSVQPIRQINLPDTHIFTPTDSETPRSKTIHYDNNPRTLAANFDTEVIKIQTKSEQGQINTTSTEKESEYWDFQHFKETSSSPSVKPTEEPASHTSGPDTSQKTFATQILQPIKLEPITPTLNWPDPGEVKETFYDFSDFLSSTSLNNNNKQESNSTPDDRAPVQAMAVVNETQANVENDDDFETFQSAPLPTHSVDFKNLQTLTDKPEIKPPTEHYNFSEMDTATMKSSEISSNIDQAFKIDSTSIDQKNNLSPILTTITPQVNSLPVIQPSNVVRNQQSSGQILQPLSLEGFSQINWPNPGLDLHDLSKFNPIESVHSLKSDASASGHSKVSTPVHSTSSKSDVPDDDWGDFVSSAPKPHVATPKKTATFGDDDEWTDFVSSPSVKPPNGLNTISFNVHTNLNLQKSNQIKYPSKSSQINVDIPTLNYITPKSGGRGAYVDKHFQNL